MTTRTRRSKTPEISVVVPKPQTKQALVIEMLQRSAGAPITALMEATGWLPHTTRVALTGLRKKGHVITASKLDGVSLYRIQPKA